MWGQAPAKQRYFFDFAWDGRSQFPFFHKQPIQDRRLHRARHQCQLTRTTGFILAPAPRPRPLAPPVTSAIRSSRRVRGWHGSHPLRTSPRRSRSSHPRSRRSPNRRETEGTVYACATPSARWRKIALAGGSRDLFVFRRFILGIELLQDYVKGLPFSVDIPLPCF